MFQKTVINLLLFISTLLLFASVCQAHNVKVLAYVDNSKVYTETYFFNGKAVSNGLVHVFDSHKNKVLEGRTDENGVFAFNPPVLDDLTIVVREMTGHRNTCQIKRDQLVFKVSQR